MTISTPYCKYCKQHVEVDRDGACDMCGCWLEPPHKTQSQSVPGTMTFTVLERK